jgi:hypothetical protein
VEQLPTQESWGFESLARLPLSATSTSHGHSLDMSSIVAGAGGASYPLALKSPAIRALSPLALDAHPLTLTPHPLTRIAGAAAGTQSQWARLPSDANPSSMDDRRVKWLRARAVAHRVEAARLDAEADATRAARAAGVSRWAELPPLVLQQVLELLKWRPAVCSVMRLVCSAWGSILDALLPSPLTPRHSLAVMTMEGKLGWFESVTEVNLLDCWESASAVLAELRSMPSLRTLTLPASCAERAVDAEAVCGLTTLTTLRFRAKISEAGMYVEVAGEWVLDLSRLTTLTCLLLDGCSAVTDKEVLELSSLTGLKDLVLGNCVNITSEGLLAVRNLPALTELDLTGCDNVTDEVMRAVSSLTALTWLNIYGCFKVTDQALRAVSSLPSLTFIDLTLCPHVTAAGVQALRNTTAAPNLRIEWEPPVEVEDAADSDDSDDGEEWEEWD